jgi:flagellar M-ring protein FliF
MAEPSALPAPAEPNRRLALPAALETPYALLRANPLLARAAWPIAGVTVATFGLLGWLLLSPPQRAPLFAQLPEADKAAVVTALEEAGLAVALDPRTGTVLLPEADHARARMLLAAQGLPKAAPGGAELMADMPLGTSRAIESARLKSAQERELASSIESLDGVQAARVIIAQPEPSPFVRDRAPVTASVTVTLAPGRALSEAQSRAIIHLVAGAVPGLSPDNVAIADQMGRLLAGEPGAGRMQGEDRRLKLQAEMEARARQAILDLLGPVVGRENVTAQVAVDLDFARREAANERYQPEGALRSEQVSRSNSTEPRAIGIPGALTNTVPAAATVTAAPPPVTGPTEQTTGSESATRNYELGRSVEVSSMAGGQVRRLTAAVAIRAEALGPPAGRARRLADIRALVEGAVGYDQARGDRIAVSANAFAPPQETQVPIWREPVVVESSKWLAAALVAIALLLLVIRPLVRRFTAEFEEARDQQRQAIAIQPVPPLPLPDYSQKLAEARLLAATDSARATAVARRLLTEARP